MTEPEPGPGGPAGWSAARPAPAPVPAAGLMAAITAERRDQLAVLAGLRPAEWDAPTLCAGWRVREVVAHQTMPFRYSGPRFALELARDAGRFHRMADRVARRDAAATEPAQLLRALRDNLAFPWKPPGGGLAGALAHDVIHGLDITTARPAGRAVPLDRVAFVLEQVSSMRRSPFGVDLAGIALRADDLDWALGTGAPLTGAAQDLLLVCCGRTLPAGRLSGPASERFTAPGA
jgi:uncharacterized protein (TIGR03083 family)